MQQSYKNVKYISKYIYILNRLKSKLFVESHDERYFKYTQTETNTIKNW
jgi:hypothetical protein